MKLNYQVEYPSSLLNKVSNFVFSDWNVPPIEVKYNSRLSRYHGKYCQTFFGDLKTKEWIEVAKPTILTYKHLFHVVAHEIAHYVQTLMYGYTAHDNNFFEISKSMYGSIVKEMS